MGFNTGFWRLFSQRGHVSAKERAKMKVLIYIIKLIVAVLTTYIR